MSKRDFSFLNQSKQFQPVKKKIDTDAVLLDLVEKHNALATTYSSSIDQLNSVLLTLSTQLEDLKNKNQSLAYQVKTCMFYINKTNAENSVLRKLLSEKVDFSNYKKEVDLILGMDFEVDSDLVPLGTLTVTHYN